MYGAHIYNTLITTTILSVLGFVNFIRGNLLKSYQSTSIKRIVPRVKKSAGKWLKRPYREIAIFTVPAAIFVWLLTMNFTLEGSQQFSLLAQAFLHGHLNFKSSIGGLGQDPIFWHGRIYWGEGPLPAVLLVPFAAIFDIFHKFFWQGYLGWLLITGVAYFIFKIARALNFSNEDSLILVLGFTLGSVFIGVASVSSSWFFSQVLTTFLLFWGLYEYFCRTHKRWWLLGIICGLIVLTRVTAAPIVIFFALEIWRQKHKNSKRIKELIQLCLPFVGAVVLIGLYNFLRFGSPFNGGYEHQLLYPGSAESRAMGIFSLTHIPTNLYSLLLRGPVPVLKDTVSWTLKFPYIKNNIYGMSIFMTSPYLITLFTHKWSTFSTQARNLIVAITVSTLFVLSFYGLGMLQFGYRYSLDFLPELFLLFMIMYQKKHTKLSAGMRLLLLGSGLFNFYLLAPFIL